MAAGEAFFRCFLGTQVTPVESWQKFQTMSFLFLPTKQKRCVEQIWCEPVGDLRSGYLPSDPRFFLFRSRNKKSWRPSSGGTWKNFSHSLNCCFSQGSILETIMINTAQGAAAYQVDAGLCFLGLLPGGMGMGIVWSRSGVWVAHGMSWTQPSVTSELRPSAGLCVVFSTPSPLLSTF